MDLPADRTAGSWSVPVLDAHPCAITVSAEADPGASAKVVDSGSAALNEQQDELARLARFCSTLGRQPQQFGLFAAIHPKV